MCKPLGSNRTSRPLLISAVTVDGCHKRRQARTNHSEGDSLSVTPSSCRPNHTADLAHEARSNERAVGTAVRPLPTGVRPPLPDSDAPGPAPDRASALPVGRSIDGLGPIHSAMELSRDEN